MAAYLHKLLKSPPTAVYLNVEQSAKPPSDSELTQLGIDRAFAGKQRHSNLLYESGQFRITMLAGKNTGRLGVEPGTHPHAQGIDVTNLERTLIDITVRPDYAGGIHQVLDAFETARERVSVPAIISTLDRLKHAYPYAQAIGFLMHRAGYKEECLEPLRSRVGRFKFYLAHAIKDPEYDAAWKLFFPRKL